MCIQGEQAELNQSFCKWQRLTPRYLCLVIENANVGYPWLANLTAFK